MRTSLELETAAVLEEIILRLPNARRGRMFGHTAFFSGRKMFACLYGEGIALRLPPTDARAAVGRVREFRPRGRLMRNWVLLVYPDPRVAARDRDLFRQASENVQC